MAVFKCLKFGTLPKEYSIYSTFFKSRAVKVRFPRNSFGKIPDFQFTNKCFQFNERSRHIRAFVTDVASANSGVQISRFQSCTNRSFKLFFIFYARQPETVLVCIVVTRSSSPVAFDEWSCPEVFQTATRTWQRLATTLCSSCCVLRLKKKKERKINN